MQEIGNLVQSSKTVESLDFDFVEAYNNEEGTVHDGFDCRLCKNKEFIRKRYEDDPEKEYMQLCECTIRRNVIRTLKKSGLEGLLKHTVANYNAIEEWQKVIKQKAVEYVKSNSNNWFVFIGQSGIGKTHIASAITKTFVESNRNVKYLVWTTFISNLKKTFNNNEVSDNELIKNIINADVLYIDDFLKGGKSEYVKECAFEIINHRYNNNLTTIITSELTTEQLIKIDEATAGRIKERSGGYYIEIAKDSNKNYRFKNR